MCRLWLATHRASCYGEACFASGILLTEKSAYREEVEPTSDEQPDFLPMFPWYSGTSADMYRTIFGLVVSLKLFLGRFDMRTMQVALTTCGRSSQELRDQQPLTTERHLTSLQDTLACIPDNKALSWFKVMS